jgi:predicted GNAT family acetyltransferase
VAPAALVIDRPERERYEIVLDGGMVGFLQYHRGPGQIALIHTEIDSGHEGAGLGGRLIVAALDAAGAAGLRVLPFCPFVRAYIEHHSEYLDLVPSDRRAQFSL